MNLTDDVCAVYIDMGTTHTRAWLTRGNSVLAGGARPVGVRDTARSGSTAQLHAAVRELIERLPKETANTDEPCSPDYVAAAGMITSSLGLREIPHIRPPAGIVQLAGSAEWHDFAELTDLPFLLVPGVRCGPEQVNLDSVQEMDVMRGEETLCVGLLTLGLLRPPAVVLNLGSHWKAVRIDEQGRVASSVTSLAGELIHAVQSQTILAGSIARERPRHADPLWLDAGMREQRRSGLPRALFCARLLDLAGQGDAEDRLGFVVGAMIAADLDALRSRRMMDENSVVGLVGATGLAEAWQYCLAQNHIPANVIRESDAEEAMRTGLRAILQESLRTAGPQARRKGQSSQ